MRKWFQKWRLVIFIMSRSFSSRGDLSDFMTSYVVMSRDNVTFSVAPNVATFFSIREHRLFASFTFPGFSTWLCSRTLWFTFKMSASFSLILVCFKASIYIVTSNWRVRFVRIFGLSHFPRVTELNVCDAAFFGTSNYRQIWPPCEPMTFAVSNIVKVLMNKMAVWIGICVNDWAAKRECHCQ